MLRAWRTRNVRELRHERRLGPWNRLLHHYVLHVLGGTLGHSNILQIHVGRKCASKVFLSVC